MHALRCVVLGGLLALFPHPGAFGQVVISEFMAGNSSTLADEDGSFEDWIEVYNNSNATVDLLNWSLTDNAANLTKWRFPATNLGPHRLIAVFASSKNRRIPGAPLHTNFRLDVAGEYLGLVRPDGVTVASQFAPTFPAQVPDVSYGLATEFSTNIAVGTGAVARWFIPLDAGLDTSWLAPAFDDSAWMQGPTGVGFNSGSATPTLVQPDALGVRFNFDAAPVGNVIVDSRPSGVKHSGTNAGANYVSIVSDGGVTPVTRNGVMTFVASEGDQIFLGPSVDFDSLQGTICFWMRSPGTSGLGSDAAMLFDRRSDRGAVIVQQEDGHIRVEATAGTDVLARSVVTPVIVSDSRWHHVVFSYDRGENGLLAVYVDGVLSAREDGNEPWEWDPDQRIELGRSHDPFWKRFTGQLDDFRIYNRMLTPEEVALIANNEIGLLNYPDIRTDLASVMSGKASSVYLRFPFLLTNVADVGRMFLRVKCDDGFAAYLNGTPIASANAPESPAWDASATQIHQGTRASAFEEFNVSDAHLALRSGTNVLALQGLNFSVTNGNFLLLPQLEIELFGALSDTPRFFVLPTPGQANGIGTFDLGPIVSPVTHVPNEPSDLDDLVVTAKVTPTFNAVTNVSLNYRIQFAPLRTVPMFDDGLHGDGAPGDSIFGATIPASASTNGQMIRYFVSASDAAGHGSRWPLFGDPLESAQYLGTVVSNPSVTSLLPMYQLFVESLVSVDSDTGTRGSIFYDGEFYDNIFIRLKGGTTRNLNKKSHHVTFNREHMFRCDASNRRLRELALNAEYVDPSYIRQFLSFETYSQAGTPAPLHFPARLQMNSAFYQLAFPNETLDTEMLERQGYDTDGALYKNALMLNIIPEPAIGNRDMREAEKQTRLYEDNSDLIALGRGLAETNSVAAHRLYLFDNIDLPEIINFMALFHITQQGDAVHANVCPYRDSNNTLEWSLRPWDMNISFGQVWAGPTIASTNDAVDFTHPFYGASTYRLPSVQWSFNRIYDSIIVVPETRAMYLRRLRTLMEEFLQPPGLHPALLKFERRINELRSLLRVEANLDRAKWGWDSGINQLGNLSIDAAIDQIINQYLVPRRRHLFVTHNIDSPYLNSARIPNSQPADAALALGAIDYNPASGNQEEEYIQLLNTNSYSVDISGWQLAGGVEFVFRPGTVVPTNGALYLSPNVRAFRARAASPHAGQNVFVQGPYRGHLSARGEVLLLLDPAGYLISSNAFAGNSSPVQQFLRVTEIMYNPPPLAGSTADPQDFEYIELQNISSAVTLDLTGVRFINGVSFDFTESDVPMLAPGGRALVARNVPAFITRYGLGLPLAGQYIGSLDNGGERLVLVDATGEEVLDFSYNNSWYPITDGFGFPLAVIDPNAAPEAWNAKDNWRPGGNVGGSPGGPDPAPPLLAPIRINEIVAHPGGGLPSDAIELFNPTANTVNIGGWFLTDDYRTPKKFRIATNTTIAAGGYLVFTESSFNPHPGVPPSFGLSANGDEAWLFSGDAAGELTGYVTGERFGAQEAGVSLGRYVTSSGLERFVAQASPTLGLSNTLPRVGPVVISEIMYHPPDLAGGIDDVAGEYIELRNITGATVSLSHPALPALTWRLDGGLEFVFPPGVTLAPGASLIVVSFDPRSAPPLAAFQARYNLGPWVTLLGPAIGHLGNGSDTVQLLKPDETVAVDAPLVLVDEVEYSDNPPWPKPADGIGCALIRRGLNGYGNDAGNWLAAGSSPGEAGEDGDPPVITLQPLGHAGVYSQGTAFSVVAFPTGPLRYQWRFNNAPIPDGTNAQLVLADLRLDQAGIYAVTVFNTAGVVTSSNAPLEILLASYISQQPQSVGARPGSNATFSVKASSNTPIRYQWRFNGADIPGAINPSVTITNVKLTDAGVYSVLLTDDVAPVLSAPATLTVLVNPLFLVSPITQTVPAGGTVVLSAQLSNTVTMPVLYRWRRNNTTVNQQPLDSLTSYFVITNAQGTNTYDVIVTNLSSTAGVRSGIATIIAIPDTDHDGIPDDWENAFQLQTNNAADAWIDSDGDGLRNFEEYIAGTDPFDPLSYLRLNWTAPANLASAAMVQFEAISNRTYSVEYSDSLESGRWLKLGDFVARTSNYTAVLLEPTPRTNRFYRLLTPRR